MQVADLTGNPQALSLIQQMHLIGQFFFWKKHSGSVLTHVFLPILILEALESFYHL